MFRACSARLSRRSPSSRGAQHGFGLALFLVILVLGTVAVLLSSPNTAALRVARDKVSDQALAQAKIALIGRAARDDNRPGSLPCPDTDGDGSAETFAGNDCPAYIGLLPWRTLGLPDLRDGSGERLWYALSPNFRDHPTAEPINSDLAGNIETRSPAGTVVAGDVVARVIAPGRAIGAQARPSADPAQYVEFQAPIPPLLAGGLYPYQILATSNDAILPISQRDLFTVVDQAVFSRLPKITAKMKTLAAKWTRYPFPAPFADPGISTLAGSNTSFNGALFEGLAPVAMNTVSGSVWAPGATASQESGPGSLDAQTCALEGPANVWLNCQIDYTGAITVRVDAVATNAGASFNDVTEELTAVTGLAATSVGWLTPAGSTTASGDAPVEYRLTTTDDLSGLSRRVQVRLNLDLAKWAQAGLPSAAKDPDTSWFFDNEWNKQLYYAATPQAVFGGAGACVIGTNCITVNGGPGAPNDKQVIVALAGRSINGSARTSAALSDYLEGENQTPADRTYETGPRNFTRNDKIAILAP
jgi:hypothetical protein